MMIDSFVLPVMRVIATGLRVDTHCNAHHMRRQLVASWQSCGLLSFVVAVRRKEMSGPLPGWVGWNLDNTRGCLIELRRGGFNHLGVGTLGGGVGQ